MMNIHTVKKGEDLRQIADKYGVSVRELLRINEIQSPDRLVPGLHVFVPSKHRPPNLPQIEVNGYLLPEGGPEDEQTLQDVNFLTYVCMFSYQAREGGTLFAPKDRLARQAAIRYEIAPLMTVTNFDGNTFNTQLAHSLMATTPIRRRFITEIVNTMNKNQFQGVNIDFEHMQPADRPLYNQFVKELGEAVRKQGKKLSIALGPKTGDNPQQSWMGAFDYKTLGQEVDYLMLMTYEWGWVGGPPSDTIVRHFCTRTSVLQHKPLREARTCESRLR